VNAREGADDSTQGKKRAERRNQRASYKGKKEDLTRIMLTIPEPMHAEA
jgi:hypothetical protein